MDIGQLPVSHPDGALFSRLEREQQLRQLSSYDWARLAVQLGIDKKLAFGTGGIYVLHAVLDEQIKKKQITGDKLGIKLEPIREGSEQAIKEFHMKLDLAVQQGQATPLNQQGATMTQGFAPPPPPPPPPAPPGPAAPAGFPPPAPAAFAPPPPPPPLPPGYPQQQQQQAPMPPPPPPQQQVAPPPPAPQQYAAAPPPPPQVAPPPPATGGKRNSRKSAEAPPPPPPVPTAFAPPPPQQQFAPPPMAPPVAPQQFAQAPMTAAPQLDSEMLEHLKALRVEMIEQRNLVQDLRQCVANLSVATAIQLRQTYQRPIQKLEDLSLEATLAECGMKGTLPPR